MSTARTIFPGVVVALITAALTFSASRMSLGTQYEAHVAAQIERDKMYEARFIALQDSMNREHQTVVTVMEQNQEFIQLLKVQNEMMKLQLDLLMREAKERKTP